MMKLRVLRKDIFVSSYVLKGWRSKSISRTKDILQMWDDKEGWIDVPVVNDRVSVYNTDGLEVSSY